LAECVAKLKGATRMVLALTRLVGVGLLTCAFLASSIVASADTSATVVGQVTCGADELTPASHIVVVAQGLQLQTVTDDTGHYALTNLPSGISVTIEAVSDPQASVVVSRGAIVLGSGQTLDIGSMDLAVCGQPVTPQPTDDYNPIDH
jgi:hypothetical protein